MLTNNLEQLKKASREGYAIPAINTQGGNYDIIMGICKAAEELRSPVILAHYVSTGAFSGNDWFVNVAKWCANKVSVPVSIHLDHGVGFPIGGPPAGLHLGDDRRLHQAHRGKCRADPERCERGKIL